MSMSVFNNDHNFGHRSFRAGIIQGACAPALRGPIFMINNSFRRFASVAALLGAATLAGHAQSATDGAISGTVTDATDAAIPGAQIQVHNNGTGKDVSLVTDANGFYKAALLQPGNYSVTITASGFNVSKTDGIVVQLNQVTTVSPHLAIGSTAQTVEISADAPVLNFDSPVYGGHLDTKEIENLPINGRRWSTLTLLTPGVTADSPNGFGLISFRAMSPLMNNVQIDGIDDNQGFYAEERGRTRVGYSTSQVAVAEFQVNTGVYAADLGRAVGGVVNTVTKSGTNNLHGEVYFYDRDNSWGAYNPYTTNTYYDPASNTFSTQSYKPKDWRKNWGFGVGGPLIKDKLFWFYAYDQYKRNFPGTGKAGNPNLFFAAPTSSQLTTLQNRLGFATQAAAAAAYNGGLQDLLGDLGPVARNGNQVINTPKIDWQINQKHHVSFLYHRLRWDSPAGVQTQATNTYAVDAFGNDFVKLDYGMAKLDSLFTSRLSNQIRFGYGRELDYETAQNPTQYTQQHLTPSSGTPVEVSLGGSNGFTLGSPYYGYRFAYPDERKWQIGDTASFIAGKHSIRFGTDILHNYDLQNNLYHGNAQISYSSYLNYLSDILRPAGSNGTCDTARTGAGNLPCYDSYDQGFGPTTFDLATTDLAFFVQDDWKVNPNLTLNLGVRYDYEMIPSPYAALANPLFPEVGNKFSDKNNIAPRLGFAWDPFGHGTTVLRGGYGIFFGRIPNSILLNVYYNTGSKQSQVQYTLNNTTGPAITNVLTAPPTTGASSAPNIQYFDKNFQSPAAHEFDLAVQQELGKANILSVSYVGTLGRQLPNFLNTNLNPNATYTATYNVVPGSDGTCGPLNCGPITEKVYANSQQTTPAGSPKSVLLNPNFGATTKVVSNINSSYNALTFEIQNRTFKRVTFDANYTWAHALDFNQNQSTNPTTNSWLDPYANARANYGNSNFNIPNRFVGWAIVNVPGTSRNTFYKYLTNGWSLKPVFQAQSGFPYSLNTNGNAPNQVFGSAANCASNGVGCYRPNGSGVSGTSVTYIPELGRNSRQYPRTMVLDLRAQKDFTFGEKYNLELIGEAFNLANHQNVTQVNTTGYTFSGTNLQYNPAAGTPQNSNSNFAYSPRQVQLAIRLMF
jgi:hypothetical protein